MYAVQSRRLDHCAARIKAIPGKEDEDKRQRLEQLNEATLEKIERTKPTHDKEAVEIIEQVMLLSKREDNMAYPGIKKSGELV